MTRYEFYNNLELFNRSKEITEQEEKDKVQTELNELKHYGTLGQKWGVRKWQNADGTFNEAGKERYFGKNGTTKKNTEEDKIGNKESDVKDYLKFRNKMLKERTRDDLNSWYRDKQKKADKQLVKDAKKVDKQQEKMYKNQLKDFYDNPEDLVSDLDKMYKVGGKSDEQKIGGLNYTWDRMDNMYEYIDKYQNKDGSLTKKGQKLLDKGKNVESYINMDLYKKSKYTDEDWDNEIKKSEERQKKLVDNAKAKVKTTKELSGDTINDQEFKDIVEELNNFHMRDFYKNHRKEYNDVADIGMDALNKSDEYGSESKIGDDGDREWFMWEDQTIGNPEIAYLYYKGYSKDYIKQYLNKPLTEELLKMQDEDPYAGGFFVRDEFHRGGDAYIDALFDKGEEDQKIGGLFNKTPEEKEAKKLAKEAKELEKEFTTTSKYDSSYKYLDGEKIDKWLDKEENKAVEKAYADAMETAFGDTSKELHELFKDYDDNPDKYVAKAAICDSLDWYDNLGDISSEVRWFIGDDGDQGDRNSHAYYLNTKGYDEKQIDKKFWEANEKLNEGYEVGKKLSQYYNPVILNMSEKLQKELYNRINYRWEKSDNYSYNKLLEASEGGTFNKDHMKIADDFEKKLKPSCSDKNGDGWWYFNQAVRNLDMEGLNYKDMTQSDWDRINAEINKLKK